MRPYAQILSDIASTSQACTYFVKEAIKVDMDRLASHTFQQYVLAVTIAKPKKEGLRADQDREDGKAYPSTKPTIDMTAVVREYANRARSQAEGSGKLSRNHSWNTGGYLETELQQRLKSYPISQSKHTFSRFRSRRFDPFYWGQSECPHRFF